MDCSLPGSSVHGIEIKEVKKLAQEVSWAINPGSQTPGSMQRALGVIPRTRQRDAEQDNQEKHRQC